MGILITRRPDSKIIKERAEWLKQHPEEIEQVLNDAICDNTDAEFDAINRSGANIDYGGRIQINKEKLKNR